MRLSRELRCAVLATALLAPAMASAHPHVLVDGKEELVFAQGKLTAIRHIWQFDPAFTAFAIQGLDTNNDGKLSDAELAPLAKVNVDSLKEFAYFSYLTVDGKNVDFAPPTEYWLQFNNAQLTLFYTLPLKTPVAITDKATLEVFDPEYFVAFSFPGANPVTLDSAPAGCSDTLIPPKPLDAQTMAILAAIPADQQVLPPALRQQASVLANVISVSCKAGAAAIVPISPTTGNLTPADLAAGFGASSGGLGDSDLAKITAAERARLATGTFGQ